MGKTEELHEARVRIAELERQLAESRDFAISEAAKIRTSYERQQGVLVARLRESNGILQAFKTQSQTSALQLIDNELTLEHIGLVRDSVKPVTMLNGLTEAETTASASVAGLMGGE
ncbi:MAG TPA: hypothetical protein PKL28_07115 [Rhodocyclaceae bacterium]|nr:hypothetical protein [Rhodocyclaceae bacterium]